MQTKFIRLFYTVKYLKMKQIYYRIFYAIRKKLGVDRYKLKKDIVSTRKLSFSTSIRALESYKKGCFEFLNKEHTFFNSIDWNFDKYGKLWTYNLTYFDFLNQEGISKNEGIRLINDFISNMEKVSDGLEPFPISLRGINWVKFLSEHKIDNENINVSLYGQYSMLVNHLEYHLLGNHLLENAFSLLFGAYYFEDDVFYKKANELLLNELDEQILEDGAHFELSPMYHQIMLYRVLDCVNLVSNNQWKEDALLETLVSKAELMFGWLNNMTFKNGNIPLFNDSAKGIAPTTLELNAYAKRLGIFAKESKLRESGYRKFICEDYELIVDVGNIGPDYIPGHAHSDTFNFELYVDGEPVIVDTGLSTYETNERRSLERSTQSHNTVMINEKNQSDVWGGFRVAKRAKIVNLQEEHDFVKATHDGYKDIGLFHTRSFSISKYQIIIEDSIRGETQACSVAYLHLSPGLNPIVDGLEVNINVLSVSINSGIIEVEDYLYAPEFNKLVAAKRIKITYERLLVQTFRILECKN